jgi:Arc/MetJ-type ribon-helix-helix transcriptional regulator
METEKVCVNLPAAELGKIDILVAQGLYASRTDVIRAGIRGVIDENVDAVNLVARGSTGIGYLLCTKAELLSARRTKKKLKYFVIGVLRIEKSVTPDLAEEAIESIYILGSLKGPQPVLDRLKERVVRGIPGMME